MHPLQFLKMSVKAQNRHTLVMNGAIYRKDGKWLVDSFPKADLIEDLALFWTLSSCIFVAGGCDCVFCPVVKLTFYFGVLKSLLLIAEIPLTFDNCKRLHQNATAELK